MVRHTENIDANQPLSDIIGNSVIDVGELGSHSPTRTDRCHERRNSGHIFAHESDRRSDYSLSDSASDQDGHRSHRKSCRSPRRHKKARQDSLSSGVEILDPEPEPATKIAIRGVKNLYTTSKKTCACCIRWSEYADPESENRNLMKLASQYEVVHRQQRQKSGDGGFSWTTHSIIVRGDFKKDIIDAACSDYPGLVMFLDQVEFAPPFKPIVHCWGRIIAAVDARSVSTGSEEDSSPAQQTSEALKALKSAISSSLDVLEVLKLTKRIDFKSLWVVFAPSEPVFYYESGTEQIMRIKSFEMGKYESGEPYWNARCEYLDWNGTDTGFRIRSVFFDEYRDSKLITALPLVPLAWLPNEKELVERMIARGRRFEALRGYHFKHCQGTRLVDDGLGIDLLSKPVNGRVVVDSAAFYRCQKLGPPSLKQATDLDDSIEIISPEESAGFHADQEHVAREESGEAAVQNYEEEILERMPEKRRIVPQQSDFIREDVMDDLTDEEAMLANPRVRGMDLATKEWSEFFIDDLEEIIWNEIMFSRLVLPGGENKLALAACKNKKRTNVDFDFVSGKGRGLIILLFGPPGVGKSFTAEAVAEGLKVPLYSMTAGNLGTGAKAVEKGLDMAFECCTMWNAILLLDEADVFLGERSIDGLERNELVSIFLRMLEYYQGVLFLTTNRMKTIDPAFQSRIDFIIPYSDLSSDARREVWANFIQQIGEHEFEPFSDHDLEGLSKLDINGREIKNLVKGALLLAREDDTKVTIGHLHTLAKMRLRAKQVLSE